MAIESTYVSRRSALEMHWIWQDGRLRSRWGATTHLNEIDPGIDPAMMGTTAGMKSRTRRIPVRKAEAAWLLGLLSLLHRIGCWVTADCSRSKPSNFHDQNLPGSSHYYLEEIVLWPLRQCIHSSKENIMNLERRNGHTAYSTNGSGQVVRTGHGLVFDLGGPIIESLRGSNEEDAYCVFKGTLRPGSSVLLHSHGDPESFYVVSGTAEVLTETADGLTWQRVRQGDFADIPAGMKHAWRNPHAVPFEVVVSTTPKLGRFLRELGGLIGNEGFKPERIRELEQQHGYWSGTVEENTAVGIALLSW